MRNDFVAVTFWLIIGLSFSIWSTTYPIGNLYRPGPGFVPLILGILLIFLSLLLFKNAKRSRSLPKVTFSSFPGGLKKVACTALILILAAFLFERIGYLFTIFLLVAFLMRAVEPQSWRATLITAFSAALAIYLVFDLLLKQPLPRGPLGI
jgi:putative tricarboxylic transport membrane protein